MQRLGRQPGLVQQFVALQRLFLIPAAITEPEADPQPVAPAQRASGFARNGRAPGPFMQQRFELLGEDRRDFPAPVFPREIVVPGPPDRTARAPGGVVQ